MANDVDKRGDIRRDGAGNDPDSGNEDEVENEVYSECGESQWDPAPGFSQVVDPECQERRRDRAGPRTGRVPEERRLTPNSCYRTGNG